MKRVARVFAISMSVSALILLCVAAVLFFGTMNRTVEGSGVVVPGRRIGVSPKISGIVATVRVAEGARVSRDDTLLTILSDDIAVELERSLKAVSDAHAELVRSEEEYRNLTSSRSYELGVILADLNEAERAVAFSREALERARALYDKGLITAEQFEKEQRTFEANESYYRVLEARSRMLTKQMERRVEERRRNLELAERTHELVKAKLAQTVVCAPDAGVVLTSRPDHLIGTSVEQGKPLIEIGVFDRFLFSASIGETDITSVKKGQSVQIFLNSYPHQEYKVFDGVVERIAPVPLVAQGQSAFEVDILIGEPWVDDHGSRVPLLYGLMGRAKIIVEPDVRLYRLLIRHLER